MRRAGPIALLSLAAGCVARKPAPAPAAQSTPAPLASRAANEILPAESVDRESVPGVIVARPVVSDREDQGVETSPDAQRRVILARAILFANRVCGASDLESALTVIDEMDVWAKGLADAPWTDDLSAKIRAQAEIMDRCMGSIAGQAAAERPNIAAQEQGPAAASPATSAGFWCYDATFHGLESGSCTPTKADCKKLRSLADQPRVRVTGTCKAQPRAACFAVFDRLDEVWIALCSPSFASCETHRESLRNDVDWIRPTACAPAEHIADVIPRR